MTDTTPERLATWSAALKERERRMAANPREQRCSACGSMEDMRPSSPWHGPHLICRPCFMQWYDPDYAIDATDPEQVGVATIMKQMSRTPSPKD